MKRQNILQFSSRSGVLATTVVAVLVAFLVSEVDSKKGETFQAVERASSDEIINEAIKIANEGKADEGYTSAGKDADGDSSIEINIGRVNSREFSCEGRPAGNQIHPNPPDCLHFFSCDEEGIAYKVDCPRTPAQTYYNPIKRACDNSSPTFCKQHAAGKGSDLEKNTDASAEQTESEEANKTRDSPQASSVDADEKVIQEVENDGEEIQTEKIEKERGQRQEKSQHSKKSTKKVSGDTETEKINGNQGENSEEQVEEIVAESEEDNNDNGNNPTKNDESSNDDKKARKQKYKEDKSHKNAHKKGKYEENGKPKKDEKQREKGTVKESSSSGDGQTEKETTPDASDSNSEIEDNNNRKSEKLHGKNGRQEVSEESSIKHDRKNEGRKSERDAKPMKNKGGNGRKQKYTENHKQSEKSKDYKKKGSKQSGKYEKSKNKKNKVKKSEL